MTKYCGKCGSPLRNDGKCPACGWRDPERTSVPTSKKGGLKFVLIALLSTVVVCAAIVILVGLNVLHIPFLNRSAEDGAETDRSVDALFQAVSCVGFDGKATDASSAMKAVCSISDETHLGFDASTLGECVEQSGLDGKSYRFPQQYQDIPVYGRSVILTTDANGSCRLLSGNYMAMGSVETKPKLDAEEAIQAAREQYGEESLVDDPCLVVYSLHEVSPQLTWMVPVHGETFSGFCFVSAGNGKIVETESAVNYDSVDASGKDVDNVERTFRAEKTEDTYKLHDLDRKITVYDSGGWGMSIILAVVDSDGHVYTRRDTDGEWFDENKKPVGFTGDNYHYVIWDADGNVVGRDGEFALLMDSKNPLSRIKEVTSKDNIWKEKKAVTAMSLTAACYDFYYNEFGRISFDNRDGEILVTYNDHFYDGKNSQSFGYGGTPFTMLRFEKGAHIKADVVGHDFTHSVERSICALSGKGESGAIKEGTSDIFGEIIEDWYYDGVLNNSCNWLHDTVRHLIKPHKGKNPDTYKGEYWYDTSAKYDDGNKHNNSTVISHMAYLMNKGVDDNGKFEPLTTRELAALFYSTFFSLPSDCSFAQYGTLLEANAEMLYDQGRLTRSQVLCVSAAIERVGIQKADVLYRLKRSFDLQVFDLFGERCANYRIIIENMDEEVHMDQEVRSIAPQTITLPDGEYRCTVINGENEKQHASFRFVISEEGAEKQDVYTSFEQKPSRAAASDVVLLGFFRSFADSAETRSLLRYDENGRVSEMHVTDGTGDSIWHASYDASGRLIEEKRTEASTGSYIRGGETLYRYDEKGVLTEITGDALLYTWKETLKHDKKGQLASVTRELTAIEEEIPGEHAEQTDTWTYEIRVRADGGRAVAVTITSAAGNPTLRQVYAADGAVIEAYDADPESEALQSNPAIFAEAFHLDEVEHDAIPSFCRNFAGAILSPSHWLDDTDDSTETVMVNSGFVVYRTMHPVPNRTANDIFIYGHIGDDPNELLSQAKARKNHAIDDELPDWAAAYRRFVMDGEYLNRDSERYYDDSEIMVSLYDMDENGTPELLITNGTMIHAGAATYVFSYSGDEVVSLGWVGNYPKDVFASPSPDYPGLIAFYGNMGAYTCEYYTVNDDALQSEIVVKSLYEAETGMTSYKRHTDDNALYVSALQLFQEWAEQEEMTKDPVRMYTIQEISAMGWDAFRRTF